MFFLNKKQIVNSTYKIGFFIKKFVYFWKNRKKFVRKKHLYRKSQAKKRRVKALSQSAPCSSLGRVLHRPAVRNARIIRKHNPNPRRACPAALAREPLATNIAVLPTTTRADYGLTQMAGTMPCLPLLPAKEGQPALSIVLQFASDSRPESGLLAERVRHSTLPLLSPISKLQAFE